MLRKPFISEYFTVPHSLIFSIEARTLVKGSSKLGDSFVEVVTKDGRQMKFILSDFLECDLLLSEIKRYVFLD